MPRSRSSPPSRVTSPPTASPRVADEDGQARRRGRSLDERDRGRHQRRAMLDRDRGILRRRALHHDEHDEQRPAAQRLRGGYLRRGRHVRAATGLRHAQRAARLEQQLRRRSGQSRLLPLQQPAQAFLPGRAHGFPGDHRRHGGQAEHVRHLRGTREGRADELLRVSTNDREGKLAATWAKASSPTIRSKPSAATAWSRIDAHAGPAALHLPQRLRASRGRESLLRGADGLRGRRRAIWAGKCTGTRTSTLQERRCDRRRRRFRHAQRARFDLRSVKRAGWARPPPSIRCCARRTIRTTPRRATAIT